MILPIPIASVSASTLRQDRDPTDLLRDGPIGWVSKKGEQVGAEIAFTFGSPARIIAVQIETAENGRAEAIEIWLGDECFTATLDDYRGEQLLQPRFGGAPDHAWAVTSAKIVIKSMQLASLQDDYAALIGVSFFGESETGLTN